MCHLRFDDTNPVTEETEYVDSILDAVHWLGFDWGPHLYYASDYFDYLYQFAEALIEHGTGLRRQPERGGDARARAAR